MQYKNPIRILIIVLVISSWSFGLSSGPGMPEYTDFESVDNTDLVNLATGDFTYSIPVLTVPGPGLGFPIVLSYHAGIKPEQEASWVGLGWNLQAGAITREVNNVPDDFRSILINESITSQHIYGWMSSISWNGYTVGLSWDSERGLGGMVGISASLGSSNYFGGTLGVTAGVNGVYEGVGITASIAAIKSEGDNQASAGLSIGVHTNRGMTAGIGAGIGTKYETADKYGDANTYQSLENIGVSLSSGKGASAGASLGVGFSAATSVKGHVTNSSNSIWIPFWSPYTGFIAASFGWWDIRVDGLQEDRYYGFLYSDDNGMTDDFGTCSATSPCYSTVSSDVYKQCSGCDPETKRVKKMDYNNAGDYLEIPGSQEYLKLGYTGEDVYSVQSQGLSGTFKPYRMEDGDYYSYLSNQEYSTKAACEGFGWLGATCDRDRSVNFGNYFEGYSVNNSIPLRNHHTSLHSNVTWRFDSELGGGLYIDPSDRNSGAIVHAASKRIVPIYNENQIQGWIITTVDGAKYLYTRAVYNEAEQTLGSDQFNMSTWTKRETPGFAYAWLLTAILSTDYVSMHSGNCVQGFEDDCLPRDGDLGGWVRFTYTEPKTVSWKTPIGVGGIPSSYSLMKSATGSYVSSYSAAMGLKNISYLQTIETPTHFAHFQIADEARQDAIPSGVLELGFSVDPGIKTETNPSTPQICSSNPDMKITTYDYTLHVTGMLPGQIIKLTASRAALSNTGYINGHPSCTVFDEEAEFGPFTIDATPVTGNYDPDTHIATIPIKNSGEIYQISGVLVNNKTSAIAYAKQLSYLQGIKLINKKFDNLEVAAVHFDYDYSLAQSTPNSNSSLANGDGGNRGRLTLRSVQIGASMSGPWNPPYLFTYAGPNPEYGIDRKDYWGNYCASCSIAQRQPDGTANAWNLSKIATPSGAEIGVDYEPKTIQYSEGIPLEFDGDQVGNYFTVKRDQITVSDASIETETPSTPINIFSINFNLKTLGLNKPNEIPGEVADLFHNNYVAFLGEFYLQGEADFSNLPKYPGAKYIIEAPRIEVEGEPAFSGDPDPNCRPLTDTPLLVDGLAAESLDLKTDATIPTAIQSDRINCLHLHNCKYYVGMELDNLVDAKFHDFEIYNKRQFCTETGTRTEYHVTGSGNPKQYSLPTRVWAIRPKTTPNPSNPDFPTFNPKLSFYGGGIRVSTLKFIEPFSNKTNTVNYIYSEAATPTLPQSQSNYSLDLSFPEEVGVKPYLGGAGVLNGTVAAKFNFENHPPYSTEYNFITSKDLPVRVIPTALSSPGSNNLRSKVKILDRSGLWGSLWKTTDRSSTDQIVRSNVTQWTNRISASLKSELGVGSENLDFNKSDQLILKENDLNLKVLATSTEEPYFGLTQKIWGNRFISKASEEAQANAKDGLISADNGAYSTQIEIVRFTPIARQENTTQDGLTKTIESNLYDFISAIPLLQIQSNRKVDGSDEYYATLKSLAYRHFPVMQDSNMLSQAFSSTTFRFDQMPADFLNLSTDDLSHVVSSQFTLWNDFGSSTTKTHLYRQAADYKLENSSGFIIPEVSDITNPKWQLQGLNTQYDDFGHVTEFENPLGQFSSEIYDYGQSLPSAYAQSAHRNEIFYQSFETRDYNKELLPGMTNQSSINLRSKTGDEALKVSNCLETVGGSYIDKQECLMPEAKFWVGHASDPFVGCNADFSRQFSSSADCNFYFSSHCILGTFSCRENVAAPSYYRDKSMVCFSLPNFPVGRTYIASAWYYDEYQGSDPNNPTSTEFTGKTTQVTRPGIFIGQDGGCAAENHPNGVKLDAGGFSSEALNGSWNADQRALGEKKWKRIWKEYTPSSSCSSTGAMDNAILCLYASKGSPGSDVYYDEVRVRPKDALMSTYTYNASGNMTSMADANEVSMHFEYDKFGNLSGIRNDDGKLLTEQAKKIGEKAFTYNLRPTGHFGPSTNSTSQNDGCEAFEIETDPVGYDKTFDFIGVSPATLATYKESVGSNGEKISSLCYAPDAAFTPFQVKLLMHGTGKIHTFDVPARGLLPITINGCIKSDAPPWLYDIGVIPQGGTTRKYDGTCREIQKHGTTPFYTTVHSSFYGIRLPDQEKFKELGIMSSADILTGYQIKIDFPAQIYQGPWFGTLRAPVLPLHLRLNYFGDIGSDYSFPNGIDDGPEQYLGSDIPRIAGSDYVMVQGQYPIFRKGFSVEFRRPVSKVFTNELLGPLSNIQKSDDDLVPFTLYGNGQDGNGFWPVWMVNDSYGDKAKDIKIFITPITTDFPNPRE